MVISWIFSWFWFHFYSFFIIIVIFSSSALMLLIILRRATTIFLFFFISRSAVSFVRSVMLLFFWRRRKFAVMMILLRRWESVVVSLRKRRFHVVQICFSRFFWSTDSSSQFTHKNHEWEERRSDHQNIHHSFESQRNNDNFPQPRRRFFHFILFLRNNNKWNRHDRDLLNHKNRIHDSNHSDLERILPQQQISCQRQQQIPARSAAGVWWSAAKKMRRCARCCSSMKANWFRHQSWSKWTDPT